MATYKIPQDVEAEDKLLGPLTFKQFIFALIAVGAAIVAWLMFQIHPILTVLPLPVILVFAGLAVFRREDQPVERYLLSFFNFALRPKTRVWSTEGYYEHLVITKQKKQPLPELKQDVEQVHGQLKKLAQVVDTRGWSTKRPDLVTPGGPTDTAAYDDRLFMPEQQQEPEEVHDREDILNEENPEAQHLDSMLQEQTSRHREQLVQNMRQQADEIKQKEAAKNQEATGSAQQTDQTTTDNASQDDQTQEMDTAAIPHYNPYPEGIQQHRINPDGSSNFDGDEDNAQVTATEEDSSDKASEPENPSPGTNTNDVEQTDTDNSDILKRMDDLSEDLSVSQVSAVFNKKSDDDDELSEGEEVKLR